MSCYYCTGGDVVCRECGREQSEYIVGLERAHADAKTEVDRLRSVIERIDDECGGDVSPGYIQSIARHALMDLPNAQDQRRGSVG